MELVGQSRLKEKFASYTLDTIPKTLLLLGDSGCGKDLFASYLADCLGLPLVKLSTGVTALELQDYQQSPVARLYSIDLSEFTEKQQNQFLKFTEEPSDTVFIILMARSEMGILPTILSRCFKIKFDEYTKDDLIKFESFTINPNDLLYEVCRTPGQVMNQDGRQLLELQSVCRNMILKIHKAAYANILAFAACINTKADYNKYDLDIFLKLLEKTAFEEYLNNGSKEALKTYLFVNKSKQTLLNKTLSKESYILNFLTEYWKEAVEWN